MHNPWTSWIEYFQCIENIQSKKSTLLLNIKMFHNDNYVCVCDQPSQGHFTTNDKGQQLNNLNLHRLFDVKLTYLGVGIECEDSIHSVGIYLADSVDVICVGISCAVNAVNPIDLATRCLDCIR